MQRNIEILNNYGWLNAAIDTLGFLLMLFGIACLYVLGWAVTGG